MKPPMPSPPQVTSGARNGPAHAGAHDAASQVDTGHVYILACGVTAGVIL